jgi:hypothetical protein
MNNNNDYFEEIEALKKHYIKLFLISAAIIVSLTIIAMIIVSI